MNHNEIKIDYPRTEYKKINQKIKNDVGFIIDEFMEYAKDPVQEEFPYSLDISYQSFIYHNYLSFAFFVTMDTGGAHPDHRIFTITYNIETGKFITIDDLGKNGDVLNILSEKSFQALSQYPAIQKFQMEDMLFEGTRPMIDNFKNFVFTPQGIVVFFEHYQVAPYAAGSFKVLIPYSNFKFFK